MSTHLSKLLKVAQAITDDKYIDFIHQVIDTELNEKVGAHIEDMINKRRVDRILPELQRMNNQEVKEDKYTITPLQEYIDAATEYIIGAFREFVSINDSSYNEDPYSFDSMESYAGYLSRLISILKDYNMGAMFAGQQFGGWDQSTPSQEEELSFDDKEVDEIAGGAAEDNVKIYFGILKGLENELNEARTEIKETGSSFEDEEPFDDKFDPYSDEFQSYIGETT